MRRLHRWLGAFLVLTSVAIAGAARSYTVGFLVDPVGPRGLPYLVAGLFLLSGGALLFRKEPATAQPHAQPPSRAPLGPQAICIGILIFYAAAIPLLGFLLSTILAMAGMSRLFGGRWLPGLLVGLVFALSLYGLFAYGFALELPAGTLFGRGL